MPYRKRMLLGLILAGLAACTKHAGGAPHDPGTLVAALSKEPIALDPLLLEGISASTASELLFSDLVVYDDAGRLAGDLAQEVPSVSNGGVSAGGKRVTFHLRHGVRWQDGAPVTSQDVLFTYRAVMNPANNVPERFGFDEIKSIEAPDPYTVTLNLKRPYSPIVTVFLGGDSNYPVLPAHLLANRPNVNAAPFNESPIGSGPFRVERWQRGDRLILSANAAYYAGTPRIKELVLPFIHDDSTAIAQLQTGEVDAAFMLDASRISQLRAIPNHRVVVTPVPWFYGLSFNLEDPALSDHAVRQAFALAIDRASLTRKISQGLYDSDSAMRGLFTWAYDPHVRNVPFDPARAASLLTSDGWVPGPDGIRVKNGRKLQLELSFPAGSGMTTRFATAIAAQERAVGIDTTLHQYDRTQYLSNEGPLEKGRYQVSLYDYQANYDPDVSWLVACNQSAPHGFNIAHYCNSEVDRMLERGTASFSRTDRADAYRVVQQRLVTDLPYFVICQISEVDVIPAGLAGYAPPILSPFNSAARWRWANPTRPAD